MFEGSKTTTIYIHELIPSVRNGTLPRYIVDFDPDVLLPTNTDIRIFIFNPEVLLSTNTDIRIFIFNPEVLL